MTKNTFTQAVKTHSPGSHNTKKGMYTGTIGDTQYLNTQSLDTPHISVQLILDLGVNLILDGSNFCKTNLFRLQELIKHASKSRVVYSPIF